MEELSDDLNYISGRIVSCAMKTHSLLGPGLLEKVYEEALSYYLVSEGFTVEKQKAVPINLEQVKLDCGFRIDLLVNDAVIVELKAVDKIVPVHDAQMMTYLKLANKNLGLILNFNVSSMKDGLKRIICSEKTLRNPVNPAFQKTGSI